MLPRESLKYLGKYILQTSYMYVIVLCYITRMNSIVSRIHITNVPCSLIYFRLDFFKGKTESKVLSTIKTVHYDSVRCSSFQLK